MQRIPDDSLTIDPTIPLLHGARFYFAVPESGQHWQMAMFDSQTKKWRGIGMEELQALAKQPAGGVR